MSQQQDHEVRAIAADTTKRPCREARAILRKAYGEKYKEIIKLPRQSQMKKAYEPEQAKTAWLEENHSFKIFPNPFMEYTSFEAYVHDTVNDAANVIYDVFGVEVKKYKLHAGYNIITALNEAFPGNGIIICILRTNSCIIERQKLIVMVI